MNYLEILNEYFQIEHTIILPEIEKDAEYATEKDISNTSDIVRNKIQELNINLYKHQFESIKGIQSGKHVMLSTGTGSGKSLAFYLSCLEVIKNDLESKVFVFYPMKALANEQLDRWNDFFKNSQIKIGKIDGSVDSNLRLEILNKSNIILFTPDVFHAWFMKDITNYFEIIKKVKLIIFDELHLLKGLFGTQTSFMFHRFQAHCNSIKKNNIQYLATSGTLNDPKKFFSEVFNLEQENIHLINTDTSKKQPITYYFLDKKENGFVELALRQLVTRFAKEANMPKFLCFTDSRQATGKIADQTNNQLDFEEDQIVQYRSTADNSFNLETLRRFNNNEIKGIITTSALEVGLDIKDLELLIIFGLPSSNNSLKQRLGRVGRHKPGVVLIINNGSLKSNIIFNDLANFPNNIPNDINNLYLKNDNILWSQVKLLTQENNADLNNWISNEPLLEKFNNRNNNPYNDDDQIAHHKYTLRKFGEQWQIICQNYDGDVPELLDTIQDFQVIRECYPGATFYHNNNKYTVRRIIKSNGVNKAIVRANPRTNPTKPLLIPTITGIRKLGNSLCKVGKVSFFTVDKAYILNRCNGYKSGDTNINYPISRNNNHIEYKKEYFDIRYETSAVVLIHNDLNKPEIQINLLSEFLLKVMQVIYPFDKQDMNSGSGRFGFPNNTFGFNVNERYLIWYDTHEILELSKTVACFDILKMAFQKATEIIEKVNLGEDRFDLNGDFKTMVDEGVPFNEVTQQLIFDINEQFQKNNLITETIISGGQSIIRCLREQMCKVNLEDGVYKTLKITPHYNNTGSKLIYRPFIEINGIFQWYNRMEIIDINLISPIEGHELKYGDYDIEEGEFL